MSSNEFMQVTLHDGSQGAPAAGSSFSLSLQSNGTSLSLREAMSQSNRQFECTLEWRGETRHFEATRGNYAFWLPLTIENGLKIVIDTTDTTLENVAYIQDLRSPIFPQIEWVAPGTLKQGSQQHSCVVIYMERLIQKPAPSSLFTRLSTLFLHTMQSISTNFRNHSVLRVAIRYPKYLLRGVILELKRLRLSSRRNSLEKDFPNANALLECPLTVSDICAKEFARWKLLPEDVWYKNTNRIAGKIIDFHEFEFMPDRYAFPVDNVGLAELQELYRTAPHSKARGTLYQGFTDPHITY